MTELKANVLVFASIIACIGIQSWRQIDEGDKFNQAGKNIITIDSHIDIRDDFNTRGNDAGKETADQIDLPKLEKGGLDVAVIALFADPDKPTAENYAAARHKVETKYQALQRWVGNNPGRLAFAKSAGDIESIKKEGKHAILLSFLNAFWFDKDLSLIDTFYKKGVRVFGFNHAGNTAFAGSSRPVAAYGDLPNQGLTPLGEKGVERLNKLGILIDVSQLSTPAFYKVVQLSQVPVVATHSAVKGIVDAPRNLSDDELKALAAKGGVVQVVAFAGYVKKDSTISQAYLNAVAKPFGLTPLKDDPKAKLNADDYKRYQAAYLDFSRNEWHAADISDLIAAIDYAVRLIGIDHVGISSDFNHGGGVRGYANVGDAANVTDALLKHGYSEDDVRKLWGGNFLRVLKQAEQAAGK